MATVTIAMGEMIMSLVLDHENKKLIWRALNLVHEVEFNEKWKSAVSLNMICFIYQFLKYKFFQNNCFKDFYLLKKSFFYYK